MNVTVALDDLQSRAVEHSAKAGPVSIVGGAGSGKSVALVRRALRLAAGGAPVVLTSPAIDGVARLRESLSAVTAAANFRCVSFGDLAFELLAARPLATTNGEVVEIDDARAVESFAEIGARLFALDWDEFALAALDPEVPGLRTPERFATTAFRLIRKLRLGGIDPDTFLREAQRGATSFYGRLPNFANPQLMVATQAQHRDSLRASPQELAQQHARETDLAKILARLYREYCQALVERGLLTPADAVVEAARLAGAGVPARYVLVDDAQDLARSELAFVRALCGGVLTGATFAGDAAQATRTFEARGIDALGTASPEATYALAGSYRCSPPILASSQAILAGTPAARNGLPAPRDGLTFARFETEREEASAIARTVAELVARGVSPSAIAVVLRTLRCVDAYATALLANGVPIDFAGEASLYDFRPVEDALAPLWAVADPNRHDWLLRNLEAPWLALSDATIALLCGSPSDPQPALFEMPEEPDDEDRRWDRQRDLRLARNVLRGDRDRDLPAGVRERLEAFRAARLRWIEDERTLELPARTRLVFDETVAATVTGDATSRFAAGLIARLQDDVDRFWRTNPRGSLLDFLRWAERVAADDAHLARVEARDPNAVSVVDVEAAKGREFDHVFVADVRAGAFPRYYVPDAFLFVRKLGLVAKDNVGDAATAQRTAKFSYAHHTLDLRGQYNAQERRALACAMTRARHNLWVSASGRATQGKAAPELLEELLRR